MFYLLKPVQAGPLTLTNRLVMPPMATAKADPDGKVNQSILDYYAEKSEGGYLSLIIIEHSYIQLDGKASDLQLSVSDDSVVEGLKKLAEVIHHNGSKAVMQINHAGSNTTPEITGTTPVAPSAVSHPRRGSMPNELTLEEIANIIRSFQSAARRTKEAGFDGVEIHSAHGYLLNQFFSPLTNKRTDEYGGNVHNRVRLHLQVIEAIRAAVGDDFPILLRLGASDFREGGITIEDSQVAAQKFENAGVNILDISGGFTGYIAPDLSGQGYFAPLSEAIKKVMSIPVILTGGITEVQAAEQLLADGKADLIGVGRAILNNSKWAERAINSLR
ncbi:NADH:flavin oxidoreductase [Desulfosporosinus sp. BICA1-9]|uniref:NADH:flavin oxidoreductase n=1 Tax=Desulfosporosinus sp. BICA1-9 TaxID=1531958 RepID=UPI00054B91DA|nr:NADH:flavin oxidoreductase [Desulfosporosinus sp. BICA1-9]KJS46883.1 MAG: NADH oxidase [Peptococcaceae bacterium BRH_c23]KJS83863.1 MAG: NADH oxidase [Desulfosporosinus sp. BICA1-9]HBW38704.1 NADH:flavin oxidoreductase [Desulfosporosinus sp.]